MSSRSRDACDDLRRTGVAPVSIKKFSLHLLVGAHKRLKTRLKAIIQSQRQARRLSYWVVPVQRYCWMSLSPPSVPRK